MCATQATPREWTDDEIALTEETAERLSSSVGRTRAEQVTRASESVKSFLLELADAQRPLTEAAAIQTTACEILARRLGAEHVVYWEVTADDEVIARAEFASEGITNFADARRWLSDYDDRMAAELRAGQSTWRDDVEAEPGVTPEQLKAYVAAQTRSWAVVPLVKDDELVATLGINFVDPHEWTPDEITLIEDVAERTWAAVERGLAEQRVLERESRHRTLLENMEQGYCLMELVEGDPLDFRFVETNPAFERLTRQEDVVGRTIREIDPDVDEQVLDRHRQVVETKKPDRFELHAWDRWYEGEVVPMSAPGQVAVQFVEITDRKATAPRAAEAPGQEG